MLSKTSDPLFPIYKINYITQTNVTESICVFYGDNIQENNPTLLLSQVPEGGAFVHPLYKSIIFTEKELTDIRENNTNILFSPQFIHRDDSIGAIKLKIMQEWNQQQQQQEKSFSLDKDPNKIDIALEEIYLFCQQYDILDAVSVYQSLTQDNKLKLNRTRLDLFVKNLLDAETGQPVAFTIEDKEVYTYEDILALDINNKRFLINKVLGQKFFIVNNEYFFVCNPFLVAEYDDFIERASRKTLTTLNAHLLLNMGDIQDNNLFLCLAQDVLATHQTLSVGLEANMEEYSVKIYYPKLFQSSILSLEDLQNNHLRLVEESNRLLSPDTLETFSKIDLFYNVYAKRSQDLRYKKQGIKNIHMVIHPETHFKIPLEVLFKITHTTESNPLIKYNASSRQEKIYRLYANNVAKDGRKIPFLNAPTIFKLMKTMGKHKSVSIYIEIKNQIIFCEFDEHGNIAVSASFDQAILLIEWESMVKEHVNPIIQEIKDFVEQSGYSLSLFESCKQPHLEIKQITYDIVITLDKELKWNKIKGCLSSAFLFETSTLSLKQGAMLRFKRVSNFNKRNSQEAYVIEKQKQGYLIDEIIQGLMENYKDMTERQAEELISKLISELQVERGVKRRDIEIKINPGFPVFIKEKPYTSDIVVTIDNINDIYYLDTIPIYIDTLVRLSSDKTTTQVPLSTINQLCVRIGKEENNFGIQDDVSSFESSLAEQEIPILENDELDFEPISSQEAEEKVNNAIRMFYGEDEEEEEEEEEEEDKEEETEQKGGELTSENTSSSSSEPSEASIESFRLSNESEANESEANESEPINSHDTISQTLSENVLPSDNLLPKEPSNMPSFSPDNMEGPKADAVVADAVVADAVVAPSLLNQSIPVKKKAKQIQQKLILEDSDDEGTTLKEKNIENMPLSNKNSYFQNRIFKHDPVLIIKQETPQFSSYSRACNSTSRRQPVLLTQEELNKINQEKPGYLKEEDVVQYGSHPDKQFYYICPRYWDLQNETIITEEEIKAKGLESKIIPENAKKVPPGKYIYKFKDEKQYPNFIVDNHPKGFCLPCCFSKWQTKGQIERREKCTRPQQQEEQQDKEQTSVVKNAKEDMEHYIKGPEKFPLERERWGYLPMSIQTMLLEVNADCQISKTNTNIKPNHACLLRHGVENNIKQSFVACIADAIYFTKKDEAKHPIRKTIEEMKNIIVSTLQLDKFIKYQNGNLVQDFYNVNHIVLEENIDLYRRSRLYTSLIQNNPDPQKEIYFRSVCNSFENFIAFLKNSFVTIDHTYLWDIVCENNDAMFPTGVNLIIFTIPDDDITNNVNILCPTNHYSKTFYEARKPTLFLMRKGDFFEPIYSYRYEITKNSTRKFIGKMFSEFDPTLSASMREIFKKIIKPFVQGTDEIRGLCKPEKSMPNVYKMQNALTLYDLEPMLQKIGFKIQRQVINYQNKVIGVVVADENKGYVGFLPTYPSAIDVSLETTWMTDDTLWSPFETTLDFLKQVKKASRGKISCGIAFLIIEDEMVVGILTETNQFIQLSEPFPVSQVREQNIPLLRDNNYIVDKEQRPMVQTDVVIATSDKRDQEREDYISRISSETQFYTLFRNTIRLLLNDFNNIDFREKIEGEIANGKTIYSQKLVNVNDLLHQLSQRKETIVFQDPQPGQEIPAVKTNDWRICMVNKTEDKCTPYSFCHYHAENENCQLVIPKTNLLNPSSDNEVYYYARMADELIRYNRINTFIFNPQSYLSFGAVPYRMRDNEIILLESLITPDYFEDLIVADSNPFIKSNNFDNAIPRVASPYVNEVDFQNVLYPSQEYKCERVEIKKIKSLHWKRCFPDTYTEWEYPSSVYCTFHFIIDIIQQFNQQTLNVNQIKHILWEEYSHFLPKYQKQWVEILIEQGKKTLGIKVKTGQITPEQFIWNEDYFLTTLDYWVILKKFSIPSFFISSHYLFETGFKKREWLVHGNMRDSFVFIMVPGYKYDKIPSFKYVQSDTGSPFFLLQPFQMCDNGNDIVECFEEKNQQTMEQFIHSFQPTTKTNYVKKKPVLLIEEEEPAQETTIVVKKKNKTRKNKVGREQPAGKEQPNLPISI